MKDQLQKELLERVKQGIKPSDLRKKKPSVPSQNSTPASSPPPSPIIIPIDKKTSQKHGRESILPPSIEIEKINQLQQDVNYWSQTAQNHLTNLQRTTAQLDQAEEQIKELQSQPNQLSQEIATALQEANQRIRELEGKNQQLIQNITKLENQSKITGEIKPKETKPQEFTCSHCQQEWSQEFLRLVDKENHKLCRNCVLAMLKRANQLSGQKIVLKIKKKPTNQTPTFTCQTCQQITQGQPHQVHISNFQDINPQTLTSICSPCLEDKVILANFYCPRTSEGKDTWNPKEAQFDCACPVNERSKL